MFNNLYSHVSYIQLIIFLIKYSDKSVYRQYSSHAVDSSLIQLASACVM